MPLLEFTNTFSRAYKALPPDRQRRITVALEAFLNDPTQPGLRFHKLVGLHVWSISSTRKDRIILEPIEGAIEETWRAIDVGAHDPVYRRMKRDENENSVSNKPPQNLKCAAEPQLRCL